MLAPHLPFLGVLCAELRVIHNTKILYIVFLYTFESLIFVGDIHGAYTSRDSGKMEEPDAEGLSKNGCTSSLDA